ncbi:MAG: leucine-rich repeat protein [Oscillospiraceae bacterium]|nr:leucine-rich repeat protein [Oscillospiraceae bacterium]
MRKCPFCKAEIEDNARFCLYCMKTLNEKEVIPPPQKKKQWWPLAVVGVLLPVLFVFLVLILGREDVQHEESFSGTHTTGAETPNSTGESTEPSQGEESKPTEGTDTQETQQNATQPPETTPGNIVPEPSTQPTTTTPQETTQPEETTEETTPPESITTPEMSITEVAYTYRAARTGDDFNAQYQNAGNDIVITGISQPSAEGVYDIPSYIDGKKVIAIVANAFSGSNAKIVYVPATVKTIWNYAFAECSLTDIYFRGNAIYTESKAFSGALTIHCSASCSDRNFRYYKNCAANYGAIWEEWNG